MPSRARARLTCVRTVLESDSPAFGVYINDCLGRYRVRKTAGARRAERFVAGLTSPADCNEYRSPVAKLAAMPLMQLIVKVLHRRTAVALLVQSQHPQKTSAAAARRLANPPVDQS
jgi:hypothetical protein